MRDLAPIIAHLEQALPPLARTSVNERTVAVCRLAWIDRHTVADMVRQTGWCDAAVRWHLRRGARILGIPADKPWFG